MSPTIEPAPKSDFMAAEEIKGILRAREKVEQERIMRWVAESLDLVAKPGGSSTPVMTPSAQHSAASLAQAGHQGHTPGASPRHKDMKTFVEEKNPKSDIQFATVVAYYYRFEAPLTDRKETIVADDLQNAARLAGWDRFSKPYVPLSNARMQGYLDRAGGGAFRINAVGENLVAMTLPGTAAVGKALRPTRKKVSGKRGQA
ncbi:MAG: hypothetical protein NTY23_05520 [Chloroflexi bacterium]|nr:hypothetical protein [Chloroflexota bacterium]